MPESINYKTAGVNIDTANEVKRHLKKMLDHKDKRVLNKVGAFSSLYDVKFPEYPNPILVLKTEEPGSKQILAFRHDRYESIGFDMINHLINDCIVMGARPLSVQDAIICGKIEKDEVTRIISGINQACMAQGCVLTGGEISEQPEVIPKGTYILTSSIVGIVDKDELIDGSAINEGDVVICLESSGVHTNGYSLIRKLLDNNPNLSTDDIEGVLFIDKILEPHRCYYSIVKDLFPRKIITGMAHITGGGIKENLNRILPKNLDAVIDLSQYFIPSVFKKIKEEANISDDEMLRVFNLGIGIALICKFSDAEEVIEHVKGFEINAYQIGMITKGTGLVQTIGSLNW